MENIKQIFIEAIIDSVPDQDIVHDLITNDYFFENNSLGNIFQELCIESLGRIWFITIMEEKASLIIDDPESFFIEHSDKTIEEVIKLMDFKTNDNSENGERI